VTVRLDFRGPDIGDFVYHCHILAHEDGGMMAIIRVLPRDAGWFGPYGKFRTLFASIRWPHARKTSLWCVNGRTIELDRDGGFNGAGASLALPIGGLMLLLLTCIFLAPRAVALIAGGLGATQR